MTVGLELFVKIDSNMEDFMFPNLRYSIKNPLAELI